MIKILKKLEMEIRKTVQQVMEMILIMQPTLANNMITNFKNEILNRNQIFVSYSHDDKVWLEKINTALIAVERFTGIKAWSDTSIAPGKVWNDEILKSSIFNQSSCVFSNS